jgi:hypothetical protein
VVSYAVMLDVPRELIWFVSGLLAARRRQIGTRKGTRRLGCYKQAVFGLAWFRDKGDIRRLGAGFGLPQSTAYRYLEEVIGVLAARAPGLQEALERAPRLAMAGDSCSTSAGTIPGFARCSRRPWRIWAKRTASCGPCCWPGSPGARCATSRLGSAGHP